MLARLARHPFDSPNHLFELKWDGMRALAFIENGRVRMQSRNLQDITARFPEMARIEKAVKTEQAVLDGELVVFDPKGRPSFRRLQERLQGQARGRTDRGPRAHFVAFDLLYSGGVSLMDQPLVHRKNLLHEVLEPGDVVEPCDFVENDGTAFFEVTQLQDLEGIVAKDKAGRYFPGRRSQSWRKIKRLRECDFVVGGYDFGGERGLFSSLLVGLYGNRGRLVQVGQVSAGFSKQEMRELHAALQPMHTSDSPFANTPRVDRFVYWCKPELVCRVQYGEFTNQGRLRYAAFVARMDDKLPSDCKIDDAPGWPSTLPVR